MRFRVILFSILFCLLASGAWGATYYVSQSGTGDGSAVGTPDSVADFNANVFGALDDDTVYFLGDITTGLVLPDSGTSGHVVTLRGDYSGQECTINGADSLCASGCGITVTWTADGTCYKTDAVVTTEPHLVIWNGTVLTEDDGDTTGVAVGEWDWNADILYVRLTGDVSPETGTLEASQRGYCIDLNEKDYVTLIGFTLQGSHDPGENGGADGTDGGGIVCGGDGGTTNITVQDCTIQKMHGYGISVVYGVDWTITGNTIGNGIMDITGGGWMVGDGIYIRGDEAAANMSSNIDIEGNTFTGFFGRGPIVLIGAEDCDSISGNTITPTSYYHAYHVETAGAQTVSDIVFDSNTLTLTGGQRGVYVYASLGGAIEGITVTNNTITLGAGAADAVYFRDDIGGSNVFSNNTVNGIMDDAIVLDGAADFTMEGNLIQDTDIAFQLDGSGTITAKHNWIEFDATSTNQQAFNVNGTTTCVAYGNVIHGGKVGFLVDDGCTLTAVNNTLYDFSYRGLYVYDAGATATFKNNLVYTTGTAVCLAMDKGGQTWDNNAYRAVNDTTDIFYADGAYRQTLATFQAALDGDETCDTEGCECSGVSLTSDPFYDSTNEDFVLIPSSALIGAGVDLGDSYDDLLAPRSSWPDAVATTDADDEIPVGTGRTIGAYASIDYLATLAGTTTNTIWKHDGAGGDADWAVDSNGYAIRHCLAQGRIYITAEVADVDEISNSYVEYLWLDDQADESLVADYCAFPDDSTTVGAREAGNGTGTFSNGTYSAEHGRDFQDWDGDDFRLTKNSILRKAGETDSSVTTDIRGRTFTNPDIGPYQSRLKSVPIPPRRPFSKKEPIRFMQIFNP